MLVKINEVELQNWVDATIGNIKRTLSGELSYIKLCVLERVLINIRLEEDFFEGINTNTLKEAITNPNVLTKEQNTVNTRVWLHTYAVLFNLEISK